jgi:hypothetical protein
MLFPTPQPPAFTTGFVLPESKPDRRPQNLRAKAFRAELRRKAQLKTAAEVVPSLPKPGESLHAIMTGFHDLMLVLTCVIQSRPTVCEALRISTLAFSKKNVAELARLLDTKWVGKLVLLASDYMARSNSSVFQGAVSELVEYRRQTVASARVHAKIACMSFADGIKLVFEGSANLRTNRNLEAISVVNDPELHDFHCAWIDDKVREHERAQAPSETLDASRG